MKAIHFGGIPGLVFLAVANAACTPSTVDVRVRATPQGPQLQVDGATVPPRFFWGMSGSSGVDVSGDWQRVVRSFTADHAVSNANLHIRFDMTNGVVALRNFRMTKDGAPFHPEAGTAFDDETSFRSFWRVWPPRGTNTWSLADGEFRAAVVLTPETAPNPNFHLYSASWPLETGAVYTVSFEAKASGPEWILPCVYECRPDGAYTKIAFREDDALASTVRRAAKAGVRLVSYGRGDTHGITSCWGDSGDDYSELDALSDRILAANPETLLVPRISLNAPVWWQAKHPDECVVFDDGTSGRNASVSSRLYREEAKAFLTRVCRHLINRYPANFAGIHPAGQGTEWFYAGSWHHLAGCDAPAAAAFRAWTRRHGGTDAEAVVPSPESRRDGVRGKILLDPAADRTQIAFNRFLQEEMADCLVEFAKTCRAATEGKKLVVFFYGYSYEFAQHVLGPANSGHFGLGRLLASAEGSIDILAGPSAYTDRGWCGAAPVMSCAETIQRHGILWLNEDDVRTNLDRDRKSRTNEGDRLDARQMRDVAVRNLAQEMIRGFGCWWMDFPGRGWYDGDELWEIQKVLAPFENLFLARTRPFTPEIAAVTDEETLLRVAPGCGNYLNPLAGRTTRTALNRSGAPHGQYLFSDVCRLPLDAKLQIFTSAWCPTEAQIKAVAAQRQSHPALRVWCWPQETEPVERLARLTGLPIRLRSVAEGESTARVTSAGLAAGLPEGTIGVKADGPQALPRFTVDSATPDETWAVYANGDPAVVVRGGDAFVGVPELSAGLIRALAERAGVHLYLPRAEASRAGLWAAEDVVSIQSHEPGTYHVTFPSGETRTLELGKGETRLIRERGK